MLLTITALGAQQALALAVKELWHKLVQVASQTASMPKSVLLAGTNGYSLSFCFTKLSEQLGSPGFLTVWLRTCVVLSAETAVQTSTATDMKELGDRTCS